MYEKRAVSLDSETALLLSSPAPGRPDLTPGPTKPYVLRER
jgi:hypothetical protein